MWLSSMLASGSGPWKVYGISIKCRASERRGKQQQRLMTAPATLHNLLWVCISDPRYIYHSRGSSHAQEEILGMFEQNSTMQASCHPPFLGRLMDVPVAPVSGCHFVLGNTCWKQTLGVLLQILKASMVLRLLWVCAKAVVVMPPGFMMSSIRKFLPWIACNLNSELVSEGRIQTRNREKRRPD